MVNDSGVENSMQWNTGQGKDLQVSIKKYAFELTGLTKDISVSLDAYTGFSRDWNRKTVCEKCENEREREKALGSDDNRDTNENDDDEGWYDNRRMLLRKQQ